MADVTRKPKVPGAARKRSKRTPVVATNVVDDPPSSKGDSVMANRSDTPVVTNALKVAGEAFVVPGASLVADGDIRGGAFHIAGAFVARALLGPIGWVLVAANSYSNSVSGKHLHEHFSGRGSS
jgi:hypothetical protein